MELDEPTHPCRVSISGTEAGEKEAEEPDGSSQDGTRVDADDAAGSELLGQGAPWARRKKKKPDLTLELDAKIEVGVAGGPSGSSAKARRAPCRPEDPIH